MPTPDLIQGVNLPVYDDSAKIPDDLATIWYAMIARGIPRFSTTAQRDAAYPAPADGQLAWVTAENAVYVRANGAWEKLPRSVTPTATQFFTPATGFKINSASIDATGRSLVWQMRLDHDGIAIPAGGQTTQLGVVALAHRPRTYFAMVHGWASPPANTIVSGMCAASDGALTIRWASGAGSAVTQIVLSGAWPIA